MLFSAIALLRSAPSQGQSGLPWQVLVEICECCLLDGAFIGTLSMIGRFLKRNFGLRCEGLPSAIAHPENAMRFIDGIADIGLSLRSDRVRMIMSRFGKIISLKEGGRYEQVLFFLRGAFGHA
jgi:hypothetical protein